MKVQHSQPQQFEALQVERTSVHGHVYYKTDDGSLEVDVFSTDGGIPVFGLFRRRVEVGDWRITNDKGESYFISDVLFKAQFVPVKQNHEQHTPSNV